MGEICSVGGAGAANASEKTLSDLKEANDLYERRYGFIFLVCATGKLDSLSS